MRRRYWLWVEDADPLAAVLDALPAGQRNAVMVAALRAALLPGGWREVVDRLDRLEARLAAGGLGGGTPPGSGLAAEPDDDIRREWMAAFGIQMVAAEEEGSV